MTKRTMENIVSGLVRKELKQNYFYMSAIDVISILEPFCETSEDLEELTEVALNSKLYNYITKKNGMGYIFSKDKEDKDHILGLFYQVEFADDDPVWNSYVSYDGESMTLRELYEEISDNV